MAPPRRKPGAYSGMGPHYAGGLGGGGGKAQGGVAPVVPPSFVTAGASIGMTFPATTCAVPIPAGNSGHYAVIAHFGDAQVATPSTPAGWTLMGTQDGSGATTTMFGRRLDGTEGATVTVTVPAGQTGVAACAVFSGVNIAVPFTSGAGSTTITAPADMSITAGQTALIANLANSVNSGGGCTISGGAGFLEAFDITHISGIRCSGVLAYFRGLVTDAALDPGTWGWSTATGNGVYRNAFLNGI